MAKFDYFVVFAEMRTGSNHLEESLKSIDGIAMHGEVFNPNFIGGPKVETLMGMSYEDRQKDPASLVAALRVAEPDLVGFRFFHDHEPRVLDEILNDPRCGKIILTRNPLESYVSLKIASETGQWRLTNAKKAKTSQVKFIGSEFDEMLAQWQDFQDVLQRRLQVTGQSAFYVNYESIGDLEIINGIAQFLGVEGRIENLPGKMKRQNPGDIESKLTNPMDVMAHLESLDPFQLAKTPNFEPPRGPAVPTLIAAGNRPLLYVPVQGAADRMIADWMMQLDGVDAITGFSQKTLRPWMRANKGFTSFAVVDHPLSRAYRVFNDYIVPKDTPHAGLRRMVGQQYGVPLPESDISDWTIAMHRSAFEGFLGFLKVELGGKGSGKPHPTCATQLAILQGVSQVVFPHKVIRLAELETFAKAQGAKLDVNVRHESYTLAQIETPQLRELCAEVYRKDYLTFGFDT